MLHFVASQPFRSVFFDMLTCADNAIFARRPGCDLLRSMNLAAIVSARDKQSLQFIITLEDDKSISQKCFCDFGMLQKTSSISQIPLRGQYFRSHDFLFLRLGSARWVGGFGSVLTWEEGWQLVFEELGSRCWLVCKDGNEPQQDSRSLCNTVNLLRPVPAGIDAKFSETRRSVFSIFDTYTIV